ncbi:hypothetical protein ACEPPN_009805 [Leptodophora sp. 'Broadleaf-Isolate-01']
MSHDPIHDWLDKILGGSSKDERKRDERRLRKLKEKAERQGQQVMYGRGGAFIPMQQTYDPQGMPIAPGLQVQPSVPASSGIGSGIPSQHSQMPPLHPRFSTRWSHAAALSFDGISFNVTISNPSIFILLNSLSPGTVFSFEISILE